MREKRGKPKRVARADEIPLEDTQPVIPGYPTRRDVVRFARELLEGKNTPPPRGETPPHVPGAQ